MNLPAENACPSGYDEPAGLVGVNLSADFVRGHKAIVGAHVGTLRRWERLVMLFRCVNASYRG